MLWTKLLLPWERLSAKQCIAMEATLPTSMDLLYQLDSRWINEGKPFGAKTSKLTIPAGAPGKPDAHKERRYIHNKVAWKCTT